MSQRDTASFIVKVCGIRTQADADVATRAGASAVGFNFYPKSPRFLPPEAAAQIDTPQKCLRVGVFVNATVDQLQYAAAAAGLDIIQLHGAFGTLPSTARVWRSVPAGCEAPEADKRIEAYLLDTPTASYGGSGQTFDWAIARAFPHRMILAGGLDAQNVAEAIRTVRPWGVDACSRLESARGEKDPWRVEAFVRTALQAAENLLTQEVGL